MRKKYIVLTVLLHVLCSNCSWIFCGYMWSHKTQHLLSEQHLDIFLIFYQSTDQHYSTWITFNLLETNESIWFKKDGSLENSDQVDLSEYVWMNSLIAEEGNGTMREDSTLKSKINELAMFNYRFCLVHNAKLHD